MKPWDQTPSCQASLRSLSDVRKIDQQLNPLRQKTDQMMMSQLMV